MSNMNSPRLPVGTIIGGKYRVERHVGDGGMGQVVAARHLVLNELFAVKLMHHQDLANPQAAARFIREAQAVVKLKNNEHIARVHDAGKHDTGELYIAMDLLVGHDLGELLKMRGVLPIHEACSYVLQACNALVEAHELGIIHRDLKPANLFLTHRKDGSTCIKVLDFGISKVLDTDGHDANVEMTGTREMMGSPLYMSPEQAKSARDVDTRTDIWALGAILYKLLTGKAPFMGQSMAEISFALLESTSVRPPSEIRRDIPRPLDACILRCLEKNIHRRYKRVGDLMAALRPFARRPANSADDEDATATVLQPIGKSRTHVEGLGGTLPLNGAGAKQPSSNATAAAREKSGTDVMPAYRPSENLRNDMAPSGAICGAQTTQPLDGHALRAAIQAHRPAERKPSFTGRVMMPPISTQTPIPTSAPVSVRANAAPPQPFQLRASFQVPTIMPPPIPPSFPSGAYPNGVGLPMTQQTTSNRLPLPDVPEAPRQLRPARKAPFQSGGFWVSVVVFVGIGVLGITAFLMIPTAPEKSSASTEATKKVEMRSLPYPTNSSTIIAPISTVTTTSTSKPTENKRK